MGGLLYPHSVSLYVQGQIVHCFVGWHEGGLPVLWTTQRCLTGICSMVVIPSYTGSHLTAKFSVDMQLSLAPLLGMLPFPDTSVVRTRRYSSSLRISQGALLLDCQAELSSETSSAVRRYSPVSVLLNCESTTCKTTSMTSAQCSMHQSTLM